MGKKRSVAQKPVAGDENNGSSGGSGVLLPGSTLEDYFHSKKLNDTGGLGQVSKHLLVGTPTNNAMAMEKEDVDELKATPESTLQQAGKDAGPGNRVAESKDTVNIDDEAKSGSKASDDDDNKASEVDERHSNHDEYEDDYESDSPSSDHKTTATSVAGMTLSDYLQAKETGNVADDEVAEAKHAPPVKKHDVTVAPKTKAAVQPSVSTKKSVPPTLISGMSLDHYLGASSANGDDGDGEYGDDADSDADSKSSTSKRKKSKTKVGAKSLLTISKQTTTTGAGATQEEYATPFQKRLTKKLKAKTKQQQTGAGGNGVSISKSILLAEAPSSSFSGVSLQTKSIPLNGSSSSLKDTKDKKKPLQHQQYHQHSQSSSSSSQPPLPKLVASFSSAHSLLHSKEHQHDTDANGSEDDERLPPLAHY